MLKAFAMQLQVYGDVDIEPNREGALMLCMECCKFDLPILISEKLSHLDFESRKDAAQVPVFPTMAPQCLCQA